MDLGNGLGHLTYSTLVHPGDTWADMWESLTTYVPQVQKRVCPTAPFGVSPRLSNSSASTLGKSTPERDKLLAATHDLDGMRQFIGADSLAFLSVEGIYRAMGFERRDPVRPQFTDHCFTGDYPTPLTDQTAQRHAPRQLSLLAEAS